MRKERGLDLGTASSGINDSEAVMQLLEIMDVAKSENEVLTDTISKNARLAIHANDIIFFLNDFYEGIKPESIHFLAFFTQLRKSLVLSFLSLLRQHGNQAQFMMRLAIESISKAGYALTIKDDKEVAHSHNDGTISEAKDFQKRAYDWIESNYPHHSDKLIFFKKMINEHYSHSNIFNAACDWAPHIGDGEIHSPFFDSEDPLLMDAALWQLANITLFAIDLIAKAGPESGSVKVKPDFQEKFNQFVKNHEELTAQYKQHPRFARHITSSTS
ncbi:MAG: hypothetical protein JRJ85_11345 [Deltaproteobacteria bacterium]|nr:hypothetical protein [Deltaproteobacteria bacterium]